MEVPLLPVRSASQTDSSVRARSRYDLAASGGEAPHPNTQYASDDKRDHAHPHRHLVSSDRYLRLFDQAHQVAEGKKCENYTRDTQSRSLWTHSRILAADFRFVSKNVSSVLAAQNAFRLAPNEKKLSYRCRNRALQHSTIISQPSTFLVNAPASRSSPPKMSRLSRVLNCTKYRCAPFFPPTIPPQP